MNCTVWGARRGHDTLLGLAASPARRSVPRPAGDSGQPRASQHPRNLPLPELETLPRGRLRGYSAPGAGENKKTPRPADSATLESKTRGRGRQVPHSGGRLKGRSWNPGGPWRGGAPGPGRWQKSGSRVAGVSPLGISGGVGTEGVAPLDP